MATVADRFSFKERRPDLLSGTPRAHAIDRWIFVVQASFFIVVVLAGFIPDAIGMVAAANAGLRPPLPPILHVHAVVMGSFLLLLLTQSVLMATGRCELHKRVGIAAFVLVPVLVVVGLMLAPTIYREFWSFAQTAPPELQEKLQFRIRMLNDILLMQIRIGILFPLFMGIALAARKDNAGLHKRMMFLATAMPMPAAIDRMHWLPNTIPSSAVGTDLYIVASVMPLFIWDVVRNRRVHEAYWIWLGISLPFCFVVYSLWNTPWWFAMAPRIMGVG
jgi:uncharacterized membrane protein YozB (DUF420 family)